MPGVVTPPEFRTALRFWWKLGWISFGGPAGQIALMHREVVERRRWLSEDHFLHALNFTMLLPGPEAQQLATYLGWRLHGTKGALAAGILFVLPSALILFGLSWLYLAGGHVTLVSGLFHGLIPAVIAVVFVAAKRMGRKALRSPALALIAAGALVAILGFGVAFPWVILGAMGIGWLGSKFAPAQFPVALAEASGGAEDAVTLAPPVKATPTRTVRVTATCLTLWWLPLLIVGALLGWDGVHFQEGLFFSKAALVTFGGAYAVLPYVAQQAVETHGWLKEAQMMAGLGLAETTPGPLVMVLQFVGFVSAWQHPGGMAPLAAATLGAAITTWVTFVPCFWFVLLGAPHIEGLKHQPRVANVLSAVTAAVVGVILNLALWFSWHAIVIDGGRLDGFVLVLAVLAWVAMERFKIDVLPVLGVCGVLGLGHSLLASL